MREAERARRVAAVAAGLVLRRALQDDDLRPVLLGGHGRAHGGIPRADDDDIITLGAHLALLVSTLRLLA